MDSARVDPVAADAVDVFELDLRHLPAPQPMMRILEVLATLDDGQSLLARTPCRPQPLLERLAADGYHVDVVVTPAGDAWVRICAGDGRARA
jgi:uncharacterized protein (DUF2249 family)